MRVVALGAGAMGRVAARTLAASDRVGALTVADRNREAAERLARECGPKATAAQVDATDAGALARLFEGAAAVMTTVGPYYRFGVPILRAAIAAGADYADLCDDWEPTLEMLALDGEARAAGVHAVIGMGASPGVTNLLAARAMEAIPDARVLLTGWSLEGDEADLAEIAGEGASAALEHWLHQCSGRVRLLHDGAIQAVRPVARRDLDFPGIGRLAAWTVGHPEPITLARAYPGLRESANVMVGPRTIIEAVRLLGRAIDFGWIDAAAGARLLGNSLGDGLASRLAAALFKTRRPSGVSTVFAYAEGPGPAPRRVGATLRAEPPGAMGGITGVPLAVATEMLADGLARRAGVMAPEEALDPRAFFAPFAPHCVPAPKDSAGLVRVEVV